MGVNFCALTGGVARSGYLFVEDPPPLEGVDEDEDEPVDDELEPLLPESEDFDESLLPESLDEPLPPPLPEPDFA